VHGRPDEGARDPCVGVHDPAGKSREPTTHRDRVRPLVLVQDAVTPGGAPDDLEAAREDALDVARRDAALRASERVGR
jgi:hypothetical protein